MGLQPYFGWKSYRINRDNITLCVSSVITNLAPKAYWDAFNWRLLNHRPVKIKPKDSWLLTFTLKHSAFVATVLTSSFKHKIFNTLLSD